LFEQAAAEGVAYEDDWPYSIHLLAHIYVDDMYDSFFFFFFVEAHNTLFHDAPTS